MPYIAAGMGISFLCGHLLFTFFHIGCTACQKSSFLIPLIGIGYFSFLALQVYLKKKWIYERAPWGIVWSVFLALFLQMQLFSFCIFCYFAHFFHVLFWASLLSQKIGEYNFSFAHLFLVAALPPLLFFSPGGKIDVSFAHASLPYKGAIIAVVRPGCQFCEAAIPALAALSSDFEKVRLGMLIFVDGGHPDYHAKMKERVPYATVAPFHERMLVPEKSIEGYPIFFLVDGKGNIVETILGLPDKCKEALTNAANRYLHVNLRE